MGVYFFFRTLEVQIFLFEQFIVSIIIETGRDPASL